MSGLDNLKLRLQYAGGPRSGRLEKGKLRSFEQALCNSYQATKIKSIPYNKTYRCLINPDLLKPDYDNKIISVHNETGFQTGDTFFWPETNTHWIILLQELTETAYFRGYIRRCRYKLTIEDSDYYVYIQGPVELRIPWEQKAGVTWNKMNYSLSMYIAKTDNSLNLLKRFAVIELDGKNWRVEAVDSISMAGIIEVELQEDFTNSHKDLQIIPVEPIVDSSISHIIGESFVKPYEIEKYSATLVVEDNEVVMHAGGAWSIDKPQLAKIISYNEDNSIDVKITSGRSGQFTLQYTFEDEIVTKLVIIESLI